MDTVSMKTTGEGDGEGKGGSSDTTECTQRHYTSLFPDLFPKDERSASARVDCTVRSVSPPLRSAETLVSWGGETETETAAGQGDGGDESDMWSDTGSTASDESEGEQALLENVKRLVDQAKASPSLRKTLKCKDRNHTFDKVLLDTRYKSVPKLLCRSSDLIITCDTGTRETYFVAVDFQKPYIGDRIFKEWPAIDQEGEYKDLINETMKQMKRIMARVRDLI